MNNNRLYFPNGFAKTKERGAFFIFCLNTHDLSSERLTPLAYNVERMSSGGLDAATFRLTTKIVKRTKLKY